MGAYPFFVLIGLPLLFPLSADPLDKIPAERLASWPIKGWQRFALRLISLSLSPVFWLMMLLALKTARLGGALAFGALAVAVRGLANVSKHIPQSNVLLWIPLLPGASAGCSPTTCVRC